MNGLISAITLITCIFLLQSCKTTVNRVSTDVLSIEKIINTGASDYEMCESFSLTRNEVVNYFELAKEVDVHEFHYESIILPCKYKGVLVLSGEKFQWEIIAGGAGYLYNASNNKRYQCKETCCKSLPGVC